MGGYRGYGSAGPSFSASPLFSFGVGLSYTTFAYSAFSVESDLPCSHEAGPKLTVKLKVKNVGNCTGAEVVQLYATTSSTCTEVRAWVNDVGDHSGVAPRLPP